MSGPQADRLAFLTERPFAHRGLHGRGVSENGTAAFMAAIAGGHAIECDVRLSRDGVAFVFHDLMLERMTGSPGAIDRVDAATLDRIRLPDGGAVPRLDALLALCGEETPLLIEMKVRGRDVAPLCAAVTRDLARHSGARAAVMSFNPMAVRWFARHCPQVARGLVVSEQGKSRWRGPIERTLAHWAAKPDFIACDIRDLPSACSQRARRQGMPVLSWTVRTSGERTRAAFHADQIIFEDIGG